MATSIDAHGTSSGRPAPRAKSRWVQRSFGVGRGVALFGARPHVSLEPALRFLKRYFWTWRVLCAPHAASALSAACCGSASRRAGACRIESRQCAGMENPDFIEVYDDAIEASACTDLIARFEASGKLSRGATGSGVNTSLKDSWDICVSLHEEWRDAEGVLNRAMLRGLMKYIRKHAFLAIAPMQLSRQEPATGKLVPLDADAVTSMSDAELQALIMKVFRPGKINIQRYFADQGGYPYWHSEIFPKQDGEDTLH